MTDRPPPHDPQIEHAVLGACLLEPSAAAIAFEMVTPETFYQPNAGKLFSLFCETFQTEGVIDPKLIQPEAAKLGFPNVLELIEACPNATAVERHCDALLELASKRNLLTTLARAERALYDGGSSEDARALLESIHAARPDGSLLQAQELLTFDTTNDATCLLGKRWLCQAGSFCLFGQTGLGKSSLAIQAGVSWALGLDLFGITPVRPLRSLFVQAENDRGDLAEMLRGVVNGIGMAHRAAELQDAVTLASDTTHTGTGFLSWLRGLLMQHRPEICWIDPLLSFLGGDVSDQEVVSRFLRNGLNPLAQQFGTCFGVVHHTPKPSRDPVARNAYTRGDFAYLGAGSAELSNWPRAILTLREVDGGYELRGAKRGSRSGLLDATGQPADAILLQHGTGGICWTRAADTGTDHDTESELSDAVEWALSGLTVGSVYSPSQIREAICRRPSPYKFHREHCYMRTRLAGKVYHATLHKMECLQTGKLYRLAEICTSVPNVYQGVPEARAVQSVPRVPPPLKGAVTGTVVQIATAGVGA
jgi:hypothetical protein